MPQAPAQLPDNSTKHFGGVPLRVILPNLVTLLALSLGLTSIRFAIELKFETAVQLIIAAAVLDALDGRIARALKGTSKFGAEFDSLADFVDFGVAPALLLYQFALHEIKGLGWLAVMTFAVAAALRSGRRSILSPVPFRTAGDLAPRATDECTPNTGSQPPIGDLGCQFLGDRAHPELDLGEGGAERREPEPDSGWPPEVGDHTALPETRHERLEGRVVEGDVGSAARGVPGRREHGIRKQLGGEGDRGFGVRHPQQRLRQAHQGQAFGTGDGIFLEQAFHGPERRRVLHRSR